ncbi:MAG: large conductance mechanosensitive channel protein MscL [Clostridia bacterium]|nr:large conductance mechanosensitive channel protein MscL [Clostridia bacterium]
MAKDKKGLVGEFKEFIMRGNVIDLAVGVIIGGAFGAIVTSLVDDIIMPVISLFTKGIDFANLFIQLGGDQKYATIEAAKEAGVATLAYGNFISAVINFLIMALVIFLLVKAINKAHTIGKKEEPAVEEAPTTKTCPFCKSEIAIEATRCPHCTSEIKE